MTVTNALDAFRRYTGPAPKVTVIPAKVARLLWPDKTDDEIKAGLRAMGCDEVYMMPDEDD